MMQKIFTIERCNNLSSGFICLLPGIPGSRVAYLDHSMTIEVRCVSGQVRKNIPFIIPSADSYEDYPNIGLIIPTPFSLEDFSVGSEVWTEIWEKPNIDVTQIGKSLNRYNAWPIENYDPNKFVQPTPQSGAADD